MNAEQRFMDGIRKLDAQAPRIIRAAPNADSYEFVMLQPIVRNARLEQWDVHERTLYARRFTQPLPRLGHAPRRPPLLGSDSE